MNGIAVIGALCVGFVGGLSVASAIRPKKKSAQPPTTRQSTTMALSVAETTGTKKRAPRKKVTKKTDPPLPRTVAGGLVVPFVFPPRGPPFVMLC